MHSLGSVQENKIAAMLAGIAIVLVAGMLLGRVARRFGQPVVIGEIAAGIALGPSLLGLLPGDLTNRLFPPDVRPLLSAVSQVGLILFMFIMGWEFEKKLIRPHVGLAASVSVSSIVLAFGLGVAAAVILYPHHSTVAGKEIPFSAFATFMGAAMSVTAFPVLARILSDRKLLDTRVGTLALAAAAIDDVLAWCMLAYVSALVSANGDYGDLMQVGIRSIVYVAAMFYVVRPALDRIVSRMAARERWNALIMVVVAGAFLSAYVTTWAGIHAIFGAFLFGFVMPREPALALGEHLRRPMDNLALVLLPVFFIVTGLGVNIGALTARNYVELALILAVACAGKLAGATLPARWGGFSWKEARTLGLLMNTRGLTELIILNVAVSLGVLDGSMFTMMVIMALVTTVMAGPLLTKSEELYSSTPPSERRKQPEPTGAQPARVVRPGSDRAGTHGREATTR
ncbi:cation:proton antiporter [Micromonospora sp. CA-259024]|uniref:cation:proton antiporter n=1 Tax=Micromonospora sp. CA-259024 TaxID=3239965 RepID=UPI003D8E0E09